MSTFQTVLIGAPVHGYASLTTSGVTTLFTGDGKGAFLTSFLIVNQTGSAVSIDIWSVLNTTGGVVNAPLWMGQSIGANSTVTLELPSPFLIEVGDQVDVRAHTGNALHAWAYLTRRDE